uniref:Tweety family member 2 n=1 Tax=Molossus molossus TaxID=27622 RepID=A0A7J8D340_MOLMO|nr:tweety family member 2 [Molossus molossus]
MRTTRSIRRGSAEILTKAQGRRRTHDLDQSLPLWPHLHTGNGPQLPGCPLAGSPGQLTPAPHRLQGAMAVRRGRTRPQGPLPGLCLLQAQPEVQVTLRVASLLLAAQNGSIFLQVKVEELIRGCS